MRARPVTVLVNCWTGSMGEGLAIGFHATGAGTVVGTAMAGLVGATTRIVLPSTRIGISVPNERLFHVNGTPREEFRPAVLVNATAGDPGRDPFVEAALSVLAARWTEKLRHTAVSGKTECCIACLYGSVENLRSQQALAAARIHRLESTTWTHGYAQTQIGVGSRVRADRNGRDSTTGP